MKVHQFRNTLILLALTLFAVALVVYSQEDTAQSDGKPNSSEKSPSLETQGTEPETEEQSPEPEHSPDASQELLQSPFLIYIVIGALIVLAFATAISFIIWAKHLRGKVDRRRAIIPGKIESN